MKHFFEILGYINNGNIHFIINFSKSSRLVIAGGCSVVFLVECESYCGDLGCWYKYVAITIVI